VIQALYGGPLRSCKILFCLKKITVQNVFVTKNLSVLKKVILFDNPLNVKSIVSKKNVLRTYFSNKNFHYDFFSLPHYANGNSHVAYSFYAVLFYVKIIANHVSSTVCCFAFFQQVCRVVRTWQCYNWQICSLSMSRNKHNSDTSWEPYRSV